MVIIVTRGKYDYHQYSSHSEDEISEEIYEMEVTLEESDRIVYAFNDFEVLIEAAHVLQGHITEAGKLYNYNDKWVIYLEPEDLDEDKHPTLIAVLAEYGQSTSTTEAVLEEYGKVIIAENAIEVICQHFTRQT
jgi:adapter protein MecA 1/2